MWDTVLHSIASVRGASSAARAPSAPSHMAFEETSSAVIVTTASAPAHAARGVGASAAPAATSGAARAGVRL